MTYGHNTCEGSGQCSRWHSFWLSYGEIAGQLQPLEIPLHRLRCRVKVVLRNHDAVMTRNPHDGESVRPRLTKPRKHCMASRVEHEIGGEDRPASVTLATWVGPT
jgi:hypothetical protein